VVAGADSAQLNDAATVYVPIVQVAPGLRTDAKVLAETAGLQGPQALKDGGTLPRVAQDGPRGRPRRKISGRRRRPRRLSRRPGDQRQPHDAPDGTEVRKYDAPKAVLMSYIIRASSTSSCPGRW